MYIGNNQKPKEGEEKLHLVIEGPSELDVQAGKKEIQRYVVVLLCWLVVFIAPFCTINSWALSFIRCITVNVDIKITGTLVYISYYTAVL